MNKLIIYDTIYGHNFELSKFIHDQLLPEASLISFKEFSPTMLSNHDFLILCPCTYGEGELTANEQVVYDYLSNRSLSHLTYYLAGIGDCNFGQERFANAVNIFDKLLRQRQAVPIAPSLKADYEDIAKAHQQITRILKEASRKKRS